MELVQKDTDIVRTGAKVLSDGRSRLQEEQSDCLCAPLKHL